MRVALLGLLLLTACARTPESAEDYQTDYLHCVAARNDAQAALRMCDETLTRCCTAEPTAGAGER